MCKWNTHLCNNKSLQSTLSMCINEAFNIHMYQWSTHLCNDNAFQSTLLHVYRWSIPIKHSRVSTNYWRSTLMKYSIHVYWWSIPIKYTRVCINEVRNDEALQSSTQMYWWSTHFHMWYYRLYQILIPD